MDFILGSAGEYGILDDMQKELGASFQEEYGCMSGRNHISEYHMVKHSHMCFRRAALPVHLVISGVRLADCHQRQW